MLCFILFVEVCHLSLSLSLTSSLTAGINLTKPIEKNSALRLADETVWLLGGSDRRLHVYAEDKTRHMYTEVLNSIIIMSLLRTNPEFQTHAQCAQCIAHCTHIL